MAIILDLPKHCCLKTSFYYLVLMLLSNLSTHFILQSIEAKPDSKLIDSEISSKNEMQSRRKLQKGISLRFVTTFCNLFLQDAVQNNVPDLRVQDR